MISPQDRINELTKRQIYYGSSLVCKLNAVNGRFYYTIYAWKDETRFVVKKAKYEGQDPDDLFQEALKELGIKKIKIGVPLT